MFTIRRNPLAIALLIAGALQLAGCAEGAPTAPEPSADAVFTRMPIEVQAQLARAPFSGAVRTLTTLALATARYHDLDVAKADGFVHLHGCETRSDEGPVGTVYVNMERLVDGRIDAASPEALIYEPRPDGRMRLIGVELAVPYALAPESPTFLGQSFQREDEFGVWGLHVWLWSHNPEGLFAESNPRVSCADD